MPFRVRALGAGDTVVGATDPVAERARALVEAHGGRACADLNELLSLAPDIIIVATTDDQLALLTQQALEGGARVLVEKPGASARRRSTACSWSPGGPGDASRSASTAASIGANRSGR